MKVLKANLHSLTLHLHFLTLTLHQLTHQGTYYHKLLPPEYKTGGKFEKEGDVYVRKKKK